MRNTRQQRIEFLQLAGDKLSIGIGALLAVLMSSVGPISQSAAWLPLCTFWGGLTGFTIFVKGILTRLNARTDSGIIVAEAAYESGLLSIVVLLGTLAGKGTASVLWSVTAMVGASLLTCFWTCRDERPQLIP